MATFLLKLSTILSLTIFLLPFHSQTALSTGRIQDDEEYVLDNPFVNNSRLRGRFLTTVVKKGTHCDPVTNNVCDGVSANNGTSLLHCCKTHCRNVLSDKNECGQCGHKCAFGELCCNGSCTNVANNDAHCGKCDTACSPGVKCEYGVCGYS
ncbi:protein GRIM REAPER [Cornus florida]|uniref:protein GRIM REAPER n=1 Tax=Cornus florida TaxID=4283 RepID=UPI0028A1C373|nr:protein GRIM REAPER [Cornus florida]